MDGGSEPETAATGNGGSSIVTPSGHVIKTNPNDVITGSTKVNDFQLKSGTAGSMPIGGNNRETVGLLAKIDEKMETLINETRRGPDRMISGLGDL